MIVDRHSDHHGDDAAGRLRGNRHGRCAAWRDGMLVFQTFTVNLVRQGHLQIFISAARLSYNSWWRYISTSLAPPRRCGLLGAGFPPGTRAKALLRRSVTP